MPRVKKIILEDTRPLCFACGGRKVYQEDIKFWKTCPECRGSGREGVVDES